LEHSFIAWAKQRAARLPQVQLGIGDDAAVLTTDRETVVTTDSLCEGTHFILDECGPRAVGRKLAGVNLSDLAAMAAQPVAFFLSLSLPRKPSGYQRPDCQSSSQLATEIFEGVLEYAEKYSVAIAGGDTNTWHGPLCVNITAIGTAPEAGVWKRSGAKPNDVIVVSGSLGGSLLGKHLQIEPRLALADKLRTSYKVNAATDISDGLGIDLLSLFSASGCGAELALNQIPISDAAHERSKTSGKTPLEHAIEDGEDFELLLAMSTEEAARLPREIDGIPLTTIGRFVSRTGLWSREGGQVKQVKPKGYTHQ
jgi:thiamine-monophosphate kinase